MIGILVINWGFPPLAAELPLSLLIRKEKGSIFGIKGASPW